MDLTNLFAYWVKCTGNDIAIDLPPLLHTKNTWLSLCKSDKYKCLYKTSTNLCIRHIKNLHITKKKSDKKDFCIRQTQRSEVRTSQQLCHSRCPPAPLERGTLVFHKTSAIKTKLSFFTEWEFWFQSSKLFAGNMRIYLCPTYPKYRSVLIAIAGKGVSRK